jgi:hypothetical protein
LSSLAGAQDITYSLQNSGVETTAAFSANTSSTQVDTYAYAVITDYTLWEEGYWVAVEGDLYDNGSLVDDSYQDNGFTSAKASLSDPINLGHVYGILATSGVCWWEDEGDGFGYEDCDAPWTQAYLYGTLGAPSISSISPNSGIIGKSGTITVSGQDLIDPFTSKASAAITGSGVTLSVNGTPSNTSVALNYSIASNAAAGNQSLTLSSRLGTSNSEQFTVGYPPAVVSNVSPSVWTAGQSTSVTITGQNFGTAPTLSVNATGVSLTLNSASPDGTTIQATATVALTAPSESVTVTVQPGYAGQGFYCVCNGQPSTGTDTATVQPVTPTPQITFNGSNISGTTQSVVAGQQIALSVPTPSGYSIQSQSWAFSNQSSITGGFVNGDCTLGTQPSASAGGCEAGDPDLTQNSLTFYWINPGDNGETVTYTYTLNNGQSQTATATFNIGGPTGNLLPTATMLPNNQAVQIDNFDSGPTMDVTGASYAGGSSGIYGIVFTANANQPSNDSGSFVWVQIINGDKREVVDEDGSFDCPAQPESGLDNTYPYASGTHNATDKPYVPLSPEAELQRSFQATMYLMWDPALPSGCTPATANQQSQCSSIPVPLGSVGWSFSGCAINTLATQGNGTTWSLQCGLAAPSTAQSSGYPEWTNALSNNGNITCTKHTY